MSNIEELEENFQRLLSASADLRLRYESAIVREKKLRREKVELMQKHEMAKTKIETIITRLKELDQS